MRYYGLKRNFRDIKLKTEIFNFTCSCSTSDSFTALMAIFIAKVATQKYLGLKATVLETAQASYNAEMCKRTLFL